MLVYHDDDRNRWIILTNNGKTAWAAVERNGEATTWARLKTPPELTEDEIDELESNYDCTDFPRKYDETIRGYVREPMTNYVAYVFRQTDGKQIIYRGDLGLIFERPEETDVYSELLDDYYQDELSNAASRKRRYLTDKEKADLYERCADDWKEWNGDRI